MDKKTADTVEIVTKNFLEKALADRDAECDVVVASQRLTDLDEANITRRSLRVQRTLTAGLKVDLDLSCTATRSGDNTDIEELILTELSTRTDDYKQQLADISNFFIQYNQRVDQKLTNSAISGQEQAQSGKGKVAGIIVGCLTSLAVFAVSLYVVKERRSNGRASLRVINEDGNEFYDLRPNRRALHVINEVENEMTSYDLNAISNVKNGPNSKSQKSEPRKDIINQTRSIMSEAIKSKSKSKVSV
jgi:Tfp pilus assembly protein PilE